MTGCDGSKTGSDPLFVKGSFEAVKSRCVHNLPKDYDAQVCERAALDVRERAALMCAQPVCESRPQCA